MFVTVLCCNKKQILLLKNLSIHYLVNYFIFKYFNPPKILNDFENPLGIYQNFFKIMIKRHNLDALNEGILTFLMSSPTQHYHQLKI